MKITISSSKKALLLILAMATISIGKVFAQSSEHSAFFKKQYVSTTDMANDLAKGKLALVSNMDTLRFINMQLSNWNTQLSVQRVKKDDGSVFQLKSNFGSMNQARPYFCDILRNHCADVRLTWNEGDFLISRVHKKTGEVSQIIRKNYDKEIVAALRTKTFSEVSDADGDIGKPDVYGFSLACGNELKPKKVEKVPETFVAKEEKRASSIVSTGYEVTYNPIVDKGTFATTTAGNNTYNTYNTVNTPPPPPVDKHPNRGIWISAGVSALSVALSVFMMRQQQRQYSPAVYQTPQVYAYQAPVTPVITPGNPIQGNTGGTVVYSPVQGNTGGGTVNYNPVQGATNGTVNYNPIQGGTTQQWVNDPIQGWVFK